MQKKKQTTQTKQIILFISIVAIVLLLTFAEDIIKLATKNKIALQENNLNEAVTVEPNMPTVSAGMIPIKWDGTNWIITTREDKDWYDYKTGKPAYVMLNDGYYRSEIERGVEPEQLMENNVGVGVPDDPSTRGTIFAWIPSFAYNEGGDIQYIKGIEQPDENWTTPSIFTHKQVAETSPDFLLTGIWFEIDTDSEYASKITQMNTKDSIYGFIANTKAFASDQTTGNEIQNYYNTMIANTVGAPLVGIPEGSDTAVPLTITDITNPNRVILKIIKQRNQIPIKAKGAYNKQTGLIEIQVTYSQYGINKIMLEDAELTISKNSNRATATNKGIELEDGKTYKITIIDNKENTKELQIQVIFPIYATLYTDGTLAFGKTENPIPTKTIKQPYGDISGTHNNSLWGNNNTAIKTANIVDKIKPTSTAYWFYNCTNLKTISNITNLDTSNVTNMLGMFNICSSLTELDVSNFNTSNVTNMQGIFSGCSSLTALDMTNFNTNNVTNMAQMFWNCNSLKELDVSNFNTSNVINMSSMFGHCTGLTTLDVSNFDTSNVTDMNNMFTNSTGLTTLDLSNFDTSSVTDMSYMFSQCNLISLNLSNFNTSNVTNMDAMFFMCRNLNYINLSSFDTSNVTNMRWMFTWNSSLKSIDVSSFNTSSVENMYNMFHGCQELTTLDISNFDTRKVTDMTEMFYYSNKLKTIYVGENWTTENAITTNMFRNCGTNKVTQIQ